MIRASILLLLGLLPCAASSTAQTVFLPEGFQEEIVVANLDQPMDFQFLPDGRIIYIEKLGNVRMIVNGVVSPSILLTLADINTNGYERGLSGMAIDAAWPARPYIYLYYARTPPGTSIYLSRFKASGDLTLGSSTNLHFSHRYDILVDLPDLQEEHNGGGLQFGPDGMLYVSTGDDC